MTIQKEKTSVTAEELVQRAHDMIPWLKERAEETENARKVSVDTIEKFRKAGFFKITQPARWGGYEMDLAVFCRVLMEIGRGCPSSAWNLAVLGVHNWEMGLLPEAAEDIWNQNSNALIGSAYAPVGKATKVDGGWILSGQWPTSSGCDHTQWTIVGAYVVSEDESKPDHRAFLIPKSEYTILDNWYVFGLKGTGSKSVVIDNVFVPDHRSHSIIDQPWSDRPNLYQLHQTFVFFACISSGVIGFAQGAIDHFMEHMKTRTTIRKTNTGGNKASQSPYVKDRLGNAVLNVRSARARLLQAVREATAYVNRGERVPEGEYVHFVLDTASVGQECVDAVQLLQRALGARGVYSSSPIQRILRDTLAAACHGTQNSDDTAGTLGGYLLGEGIPPRLFNLDGYTPESQ
ncbi:acyl-CoA dehydrogenase family protein [Neobacillus drentensis]|uniref:acyl-CoA dehydrogenase family protein n=1 Tax=Neobacillus drentensis TaxID=220684 RepID=UPI0008256318|nr:acyl-CoA dehydrogenase family protein [Neobacillus drentensis]